MKFTFPGSVSRLQRNKDIKVCIVTQRIFIQRGTWNVGLGLWSRIDFLCHYGFYTLHRVSNISEVEVLFNPKDINDAVNILEEI